MNNNGNYPYEELLDFLTLDEGTFWRKKGHLSLCEIEKELIIPELRDSSNGLSGLINTKLKRLSPNGTLLWHSSEGQVNNRLPLDVKVEVALDTIKRDFKAYQLRLRPFFEPIRPTYLNLISHVVTRKMWNDTWNEVLKLSVNKLDK